VALTRAQLLSGNSSLGTTLTGQPQGVTQGTGVTIATNGQISFNSATATGVMRLNNPAGYNALVWPSADGTVGQVLTTDGSGNLSWGAATSTAGLGLALSGTALKVSIPTQFGPPATGTLPAQAIDGSMYWDDTLGVMFVRYNDGSSTQWVQTNPSGGGGGGGSGTVTSVSGSGGTTGLTLTGGPITSSGTLTLGGTLAVANGGTGATTVAAAQANLLPTQAGNAGKVLATDGAGVLSWIATGGTGTVTSVTGTLPITVATGTTTPVVSIGLGLGTVVNGSNIAVSIPVASTPPGIGTGATQGLNGSLYWDNTLGQLFIRYANGASPTWVAAAPPSGGGTAATLAEAAAGTSNTKFSSPQTAVPKDASGMTGAALLPGGNDAARPATPVTGMLRYTNQDSPTSLEYWNGTTWTGTTGTGGRLLASVNFNGTTPTPTIRSSSNISSVARYALGIYTISFIDAAPDANYAMSGSSVSGSSGVITGNWQTVYPAVQSNAYVNKTVNQMTLGASTSGNDSFDASVLFTTIN